MERWMIVYLLPLEVWMDIFCLPWISREEFGKLVDIIGNFKFAEHAQFFLHEWGKHKLGDLRFYKEGLHKYVVYSKLYRLEYPQTPIPENIKSFDCIRIRHLDANALDFLAKITPLLTGLKIGLGGHFSCLENLRTILGIMSPMLDIQSLQCDDQTTLPVVRQFFSRERFAKLKKFKIMVVHYARRTEMEQLETVNFIMNWLAQPDTNGPRLFKLRSFDEFFKRVFEAIHEQFLAAKTARTFAVDLGLFSWQGGVAEFHLKNGIGEELDGILTDNEPLKVFQITRHTADRKTEEVRHWIEAMTKGREDRQIWLNYDSTVGSIDAPQMVAPPVDEKQGDQQKLCSSKDA